MHAHIFTLPDQDGISHSLSDYRGKWVVLYFYPRDDTPGCTTEACNFRDSLDQLTQRNVVILGVSKDSVKSHKKFAEKYHLNFPILSDINGKVIEKYGAWGKKKLFGHEYMGIIRMTYIISPEGKIAKIYPKVSPSTHFNEITMDLKKLANT